MLQATSSCLSGSSSNVDRVRTSPVAKKERTCITSAPVNDGTLVIVYGCLRFRREGA